MIDTQALPTWDEVFQLAGAAAPRRNRARCPIHGGDSPTSLAVNEEKGVYFCHVCHASGDKVDFIRRVKGLDFKSAASVLGIKGFAKRPPLDETVIRMKQALEQVRDWCTQTGRRLRSQYELRQRIARYAHKRLLRDPENDIGWELLRIACENEPKMEYLLDQIDLCRTDAERIRAWRMYRNEI